MFRFIMLLILFANCFLIIAQQVATVGDLRISADFFKERYEFTPIAGKHINSQNNDLKTEFLYTIIAEKLWALEAVNKGFANDEIMQIIHSSLTKMFARDAMYKGLILDSIKISETDLQKAVYRSKENLELYFISSNNSVEIQNIFDLLKVGVPFDSLLVERDEFKLQLEKQPVLFKDVNENLADVIYSLEVKQYTQPLFYGGKWFIFFLKDKFTQVFIDQNFVDDVEKLLIEREAANRYDRFMKNFMGNKEIKIKNELFNNIGSSLFKIFEKKQNFYDTLFVDLNDYFNLKNYFDEKSLQSTLVKINDFEIPTIQFLSSLCFENFTVDTLDKSSIMNNLGRFIKNFAESESLANLALQKGYNNSAEAQYYINMWNDYYLSSYYKNSLKDSVNVSESEIKEYFNQNLNNNQILVNYSEILTDDLELIDEILQLIDRGMSFKELAVKHSKNQKMKLNNGESDLVNPNSLGETGNTLLSMKVGDVSGPSKTEKGYSIIKLLQKEYINKKYTEADFEEVKSRLKFELMQKIYSEKIIKTTSDLANKYQININQEELQKIKTTQLNSFMIKLLGFGGKVTAVPIVTPFTNWVPLWLESQKELP